MDLRIWVNLVGSCIWYCTIQKAPLFIGGFCVIPIDITYLIYMYLSLHSLFIKPLIGNNLPIMYF